MKDELYEIELDSSSKEIAHAVITNFPSVEIEESRQLSGMAEHISLIIGSASLAISVASFLHQLLKSRSRKQLPYRRFTIMKKGKIREYSSENLTELEFVDLIKKFDE